MTMNCGPSILPPGAYSLHQYTLNDPANNQTEISMSQGKPLQTHFDAKTCWPYVKFRLSLGGSTRGFCGWRPPKE